MPPTDLARRHALARVRLVDAAETTALAAWARVDAARIAESWVSQLVHVLAITTAAQLAAAGDADPYLDQVVDGWDLPATTGPRINPRAFATGSSGADLATMLYQPVIGSLLAIGAGSDPDQALTIGRHQLSTIVRTQVADAGRTADGVALTARPEVDGYVRVVVGKTCSRCIVLAGKKYRWNAGFRRHPRCDCIHLPAVLEYSSDLLTNPHRIYESLSPVERRQAGWTGPDQAAISEGADLAQVTNARRGVYTAGGRQLTTEGTTRRGFAGSRAGARRGNRTARLMPEQIYAEAAADRETALRLLYDHGYLLQAPRPLPTGR